MKDVDSSSQPPDRMANDYLDLDARTLLPAFSIHILHALVVTGFGITSGRDGASWPVRGAVDPPFRMRQR